MSWSIYGCDDHRRPRLLRICVDPLMTVILMGLLVGLVVPNILHRPTRAAVGAPDLPPKNWSTGDESRLG